MAPRIKRQKLSLIERARAVHGGKMYVVLINGSFGREGLRKHAVAHIVDGVVDALCFFKSTKVGPELFEREAATHTFANLTLGEAVELGARLIDSPIKPGRCNDARMLGLGLYVRRAGEPNAGYSKHRLEHYCPDARCVLKASPLRDHFEELPYEIDEDGNGEWIIPYDQYAAAMARAVDTLALAIRTYVPTA